MNTATLTNTTPSIQAFAVAAESRAYNFEPELFEQLRASWKNAAKAKSINSASIAAWALIRGANPKKGFAPITNANKLANGHEPWAAYTQAMGSCTFLSEDALKPWAALLTKSGCSLKGWKWSGDHALLALLASTRAE